MEIKKITERPLKRQIKVATACGLLSTLFPKEPRFASPYNLRLQATWEPVLWSQERGGYCRPQEHEDWHEHIAADGHKPYTIEDPLDVHHVRCRRCDHILYYNQTVWQVRHAHKHDLEDMRKEACKEERKIMRKEEEERRADRHLRQACEETYAIREIEELTGTAKQHKAALALRRAGRPA